jgi:hypothetical protein
MSLVHECQQRWVVLVFEAKEEKESDYLEKQEKNQ